MHTHAKSFLEGKKKGGAQQRCTTIIPKFRNARNISVFDFDVFLMTVISDDIEPWCFFFLSFLMDQQRHSNYRGDRPLAFRRMKGLKMLKLTAQPEVWKTEQMSSGFYFPRIKEKDIEREREESLSRQWKQFVFQGANRVITSITQADACTWTGTSRRDVHQCTDPSRFSTIGLWIHIAEYICEGNSDDIIAALNFQLAWIVILFPNSFSTQGVPYQDRFSDPDRTIHSDGDVQAVGYI